MTAQTMSFRYELAFKGHSTEKAQDLVTQQNELCCFICLTFTLYLERGFLQLFQSQAKLPAYRLMPSKLRTLNNLFIIMVVTFITKHFYCAIGTETHYITKQCQETLKATLFGEKGERTGQEVTDITP